MDVRGAVLVSRRLLCVDARLAIGAVNGYPTAPTEIAVRRTAGAVHSLCNGGRGKVEAMRKHYDFSEGRGEQREPARNRTRCAACAVVKLMPHERASSTESGR